MILLLHIFLVFAKIGTFGFGGGPAMIPLIQNEVVERHSWLSNQEFVDALAMSYALPGPLATKMSAYVGFKTAGIPGAIAGTLGVILPSVVLLLLLAVFVWAFKDSPYTQAALRGVRPAIVALLIIVIYDIWPSSMKDFAGAVIMAVSFLAVTFLNVHPAFAIAGAALAGMIIY
jgi:chromate transporter